MDDSSVVILKTAMLLRPRHGKAPDGKRRERIAASVPMVKY
jgi:hypothetical protein